MLPGPLASVCDEVAAATPLELTAERITIGAGARCSLRAPGSAVSCLIARRDGRHWAHRWADDAQLNGADFDTAPLEPGDRLTVAGRQFVVVQAAANMLPAFCKPLITPVANADGQPVREHLGRRIRGLVDQLRRDRQQCHLLQDSLRELGDELSAQRLRMVVAPREFEPAQLNQDEPSELASVKQQIVDSPNADCPEVDGAADEVELSLASIDLATIKAVQEITAEQLFESIAEQTTESSTEAALPPAAVEPSIDWLLGEEATPTSAAEPYYRTVMLDQSARTQSDNAEPVEPADLWKSTWSDSTAPADESPDEPRHSAPLLDAELHAASSFASLPVAESESEAEVATVVATLSVTPGATRKTSWSWDIEAPSAAAASAELWHPAIAEPVLATSEAVADAAANENAEDVVSANAAAPDLEITAQASAAEPRPGVVAEETTVHVAEDVDAHDAAARIDSLFAPKPVENAPASTSASFIERYAHLLPEDSVEATAPVAYEPAPAPVAVVREEEEESVEAYMAQMLQRMRGQAPAEPLQSQSRSQTAAKPALPQPPQPEVPKQVPFRNLDELQRSQAPERADDLRALREVANSTARTAIGTAQLRQYRDHAATNLTLSAIGLAAGCFALAMSLDGIGILTVAGAALMTTATWWGSRTINQLLMGLRALDADRQRE